MNEKTFTAPLKYASINVRFKNLTVFYKIVDLLKAKGFEIQTDQRILRDYPSIADSHFEGEFKDLKFKAKYYPAGFEFEFYQDLEHRNPNGGYYDFDKFDKMPYLIGLRFIKIREEIVELLINEGYIDKTKPILKYAYDKVMYRIHDSCHFKEGQDQIGYTPKATYNNQDRDKKTLYNGQTKYFRGHDGRLRKGVIYHNINNMWWVILNKYEYTNIASFHLFDIAPGEKVERRIQRKTMPERIRAGKIRESFKNSGLCYNNINESDLIMLRHYLAAEFEKFDGEITLTLSHPKKKLTKVLKRTGLHYAFIEVDSHYFSNREAVSFNKNGFIGFADWASDYNLKPFLDAFEQWMDWKLISVAETA